MNPWSIWHFYLLCILLPVVDTGNEDAFHPSNAATAKTPTSAPKMPKLPKMPNIKLHPIDDLKVHTAIKVAIKETCLKQFEKDRSSLIISLCAELYGEGYDIDRLIKYIDKDKTELTPEEKIHYQESIVLSKVVGLIKLRNDALNQFMQTAAGSRMLGGDFKTHILTLVQFGTCVRETAAEQLKDDPKLYNATLNRNNDKMFYHEMAMKVCLTSGQKMERAVVMGRKHVFDASKKAYDTVSDLIEKGLRKFVVPAVAGVVAILCSPVQFVRGLIPANQAANLTQIEVFKKRMAGIKGCFDSTNQFLGKGVVRRLLNPKAAVGA